MKPEEKARQKIDQLLVDAPWIIQDYRDLNLGASFELDSLSVLRTNPSRICLLSAKTHSTSSLKYTHQMGI